MPCCELIFSSGDGYVSRGYTVSLRPEHQLHCCCGLDEAQNLAKWLLGLTQHEMIGIKLGKASPCRAAALAALLMGCKGLALCDSFCVNVACWLTTMGQPSLLESRVVLAKAAACHAKHHILRCLSAWLPADCQVGYQPSSAA